MIAKITRVLRHPVFPVVIATLLALWVSTPSFVLRYASLSSAASAQTVGWETLVLLFLPIPGVVASIYGASTGKRLWSFLLGTIPYFPLIFLGLPKAILPVVIGVPMGLMGVGGALFRHGDTSKVAGFSLLGGAFLAWILIVSRIID